mmetsp:Transcript_8514/g.15589  ORF Transcript_8514/g.15589 Transcript_8514/m.15589 type:complete len:93 (-) Transcript_8514:72-350(-)
MPSRSARTLKELRRQVRELAAHLIAAGIPERTTLYVQRCVRAHSEASWLLSCVTPLGWLQGMTQLKEKSKKQESATTTLLIYPMPQAGDFLL